MHVVYVYICRNLYGFVQFTRIWKRIQFFKGFCLYQIFLGRINSRGVDHHFGSVLGMILCC